ncbi:MAG: pilus assembly protein [Planctomycetes bacterium]|nr:pilus assembly protein [Planctomycetota bacterium]
MPNPLRRLWRDTTGAAMVEFALAFPLQLLFTLGIMQLSLLYIGHQVTTYASFAAARTALTSDANSSATSKAAQEVCSSIMGGTGGGFMRSQAARLKTKARILDPGTRTGEVVVEVSHDFELIIPAVNEIFAYPWKSFLWFGGGSGSSWSSGQMSSGSVASRRWGSPHLTLKKIGAVPKTWKETNPKR